MDSAAQIELITGDIGPSSQPLGLQVVLHIQTL
jgi:hypothetical protein